MISLDDVNRIPRFSGIPADIQLWLAERMNRQRHRRGQRIFDEGTDCTQLFYIEAGAVKVSRVLESGRELIVDVLYAGESVGEVALIEGSVFPATATAQEDSVLLTLPRGDYLGLLHEQPDVALGVIRDLTFRLRALHQRLMDIGDGGVEKRLAQVLLTFARRIGQEEEGGLLIPIHLTRQELADMVGARIETVIRVMSRWQKEGLLRAAPHGILVHQLEHLTAIVRDEV